jgi:hypothetical protein
MDPDLATAILAQVDVANGVFVSHSSSGFGNTEVLVRLYLDTGEQGTLITAVDTGLRVAWLAWPTRPSGVEVGVVIGEKPADAGTSDPNTINLIDVATALSIPSQNVHNDIHLNAPDLVARYGEWSGASNG